ncbi:SxtJ family membrane protein [Saccharicrinis fermentans]|uniref:Uncharacterized protein n=2 Tax=Saccharicrinis fermentans TaxID=982 RepID=W7XZD3_9BACT|nr:SxtJ family membrane protein [Saccharicrinis fermentans]GAF04040.1 hypothetical protein JCM21142_72733 [Saccharicrinis fermentans DSM 9555 = JCM 21142]
MLYKLGHGCIDSGKLYNCKINGIFKGSLSFSERTKKMVASTVNYDIHGIGHIDIFIKWICFSSIYIYFILMSREKAQEATLALVLLILIVVIKYEQSWLLFVAVVLIIVSFVSKKTSFVIAKGWFGIAHFIGIVMSHVVLFVIYYFVLFPLAVLQRLTGRNQLRKKDYVHSYFHWRNHLYDEEDVKKPW